MAYRGIGTATNLSAQRAQVHHLRSIAARCILAAQDQGRAMTQDAVFDLAAGAGRLALAPILDRSGARWAQWRSFAPDLVITMTSTDELARAGCADLGARLAALGCDWAHLPVVDYGIPQGDGWHGVQAQALAQLRAGGRVLVHCHGGCGRSGMMALRLLIALGADAAQALARLRAVRPCAVETAVQLAWAENPPPIFRA